MSQPSHSTTRLAPGKMSSAPAADGYNEAIREAERKFMLNYQFIGHMASDDTAGPADGRTLRAIEVGSRREVAVHLARLGTQASHGVVALFLLKHRVFPTAHICRNIGRMTVTVIEHHAGERLPAFVRPRQCALRCGAPAPPLSGASASNYSALHARVSNIAITPAKNTPLPMPRAPPASSSRLTEEQALHIFRQLTDGVAYLHCHSLAHTALTPECVSVGARLDVVLYGFEALRFYDRAEQAAYEARSAVALGRVLLWMLFGRVPEGSVGIRALLPRIALPALRRAVEYIFFGGDRCSVQRLAECVGVAPLPRRGRAPPVVMPDPLVIDHLATAGLLRAGALAGLNDAQRREYYMYRLYEEKLTRDIYHTSRVEMLGSGVGNELYECLQRRRWLIERRKELLAERALNYCGGCWPVPRIVMELLAPDAFRRLPRVLDALQLQHWASGAKTVVVAEYTGLEAHIEQFYGFQYATVEFTLKNGDLQAFVELVEAIFDAFR